ncbi:MAG: MAPEG family protein [Candidatus Puniceispirillales bacterium]|jgi:uncharacterized MAPEG superfamily protein|nr:MAPEG family protein [Alphaproteobacteria bacterium]
MTLENILVLSSLLVIIQITIPMLIDLLAKKTSLKYLFSSRDKTTENSILAQRAIRALKNLLETFPIFVGLTLLSIIKDIDNSSIAFLWLMSRVIYVPVYIYGINYLRTALWAVSLICLMLMGIKFI